MSLQRISTEQHSVCCCLQHIEQSLDAVLGLYTEDSPSPTGWSKGGSSGGSKGGSKGQFNCGLAEGSNGVSNDGSQGGSNGDSKGGSKAFIQSPHKFTAICGSSSAPPTLLNSIAGLITVTSSPAGLLYFYIKEAQMVLTDWCYPSVDSSWYVGVDTHYNP